MAPTDKSCADSGVVNLSTPLRKRKSSLFLLIPVLFLLTATCLGQLYTGSINGTITDPSGAVVSGVQVTATDEDKGFNFTATTDSSGGYVIRQLPPAKYTVSVSAPGFTAVRKTGVTIAVNENASVDFALKVGTTSEVIDVRAGAVELQSSDAVTGQVINRTFLNNLPLVNRDAYDLVFLAPGIVHTNGDTSGNATGINFNSAGSRNSTAEVLVDGATATNYEQNSGIQNVLYEPPVDSIQEFKVQQSNFSAEFGFAGSTVINLVTRSGTNSYHGGLYEFWRNQILDANDWFSDQAGSPIAPLRRNQFGGTFGGPIKKNRTFFFVDYEGIRQHSANSNSLGVPTPCERGDAPCQFNGQVLGNFEELCTLRGASFNGSGVCSDPAGQLWDPYSGVFDNANPNGPGATRQTFIPFNNLATYTSAGVGLPAGQGNLIDPLSRNLFLLFPKANLPVGELSDAQNNNFFVNGVNTNSDNKFDIKIDHRFNDNNLLSGRYSQEKGNGHSLNCFGNFADPCTSGPNDFRHQVFSLNYTRTLSSNLLLNLTYGYLRGFDFSHGVGADFKDFSSLLSGIGVPNELEQTGFEAVPFVALTGGDYGNTTIGGQPFAILREGQDTHHLAGTLSWLHGKHEFKFGGEWRVHRINFVQPGWPAGEFDFDFTATSQFANASDNSTGGDDLASFLIGVGPPADSAGGGCTPCFSGFDEFVSTQSFRVGTFFQDNYRVTPKLALNLGLRYEISLPRTERYDKMNWLDPNAESAIQFAPGSVNPVFSVPSGASIPSVLHGAEEFVGVNGNSRSNYYTDYKNIQPRIGFAYQLAHDAVVRGGYGIFYSTPRSGASGTGPWGFQGFDVQPPWITVQLTNPGLQNRTPCCRFSDPAPNGVPKPPGSALGGLNDVGFAAVGPVPAISLNTPYEQVWTLGVQKALPGKIMVDTTYLGKKGTHLYLGGFREMNYLGPWVENLSPTQIQALTVEDQPNPFFCSGPLCPTSNYITNPNSGLSAPNIAEYQLLLPHPQFTGFEGDSPPIASSIYHALQIRAQKEFANGLQFLFSYSFSKSIDDASATDDSISWLGGGTRGGDTIGVQDPNNLRPERAVSVFDIPHDLQFSYVYALPIGRGKRFGGNMHPVMDAIIGGWQTNGNWIIESGRPIIPLEADSAVPIPTYGQRPNLTEALRRSSASPQRATDGCQAGCVNYFANPDALQQADDFTMGNAPRTITTVREPGTRLVNLSVFKEFSMASVREGMKLEFRAEAFNAFNHPIFSGPHTRAGTGSFGTIDSLDYPPREMQLALKLYF